MRPRSHGGTGRTAGGDAKRVVEASLNLIGAIIRPWRGVQDATSVDRKSRSHDRCTGNSPCLRRVILGTPSRPTRPIRAGPRTPARAPPSAPRFRGIRWARPTDNARGGSAASGAAKQTAAKDKAEVGGSCDTDEEPHCSSPPACSPRPRRPGPSARGCCGRHGRVLSTS